MRIISFLGFTIVSATLLLELLHHADANSFRIRGLRNPQFGTKLRRDFQLMHPPPLQKRAGPPKSEPSDPGKQPKIAAKVSDSVQTTDAPKATDASKATDAPKASDTPQAAKSVSIAKASTSTTSASASIIAKNDPSQYKNSDSGSSQSVPTDPISMPAIIALASIGGAFVVVAGLFVFIRKRRRKEMANNIVATSAAAWEQQNNAYEKMDDDEPRPVGSYIVITAHTPSLPDELDIQPGDKVVVLMEYDDGWVQGINESRDGAKGVFPRYCVDMNSSPSDKRSSSIGGYTTVDLK